jgi:hypothetical protein
VVSFCYSSSIIFAKMCCILVYNSLTRSFSGGISFASFEKIFVSRSICGID